MNTLNVMVVDDHPLFMEGLKPTLFKLHGTVNITNARCGAEFRQFINSHDVWQLCIIDLQLPDCDGWELLSLCRDTNPESAIAIVSGSERRADVRQAPRLGARGFIPKGTNPELVLNALRVMMSGGLFVPDYIVREWQDVLTALPGEAPFADRIRDLTNLQQQVLTLVVEGISNRQIADRIGCSESTVKAHVTAVLKSLGVPNRVKAKEEACKLGWVMS